MPALNATTGMPAATAHLTPPARASGSAKVDGSASTLLSTAFWTQVGLLGSLQSRGVLQVDVVLGGCGFGALADQVPEGSLAVRE